MSKKINFTSLGCDKNRVDSEVMVGILKKSGFEITPNENDADVVVVNTCCFIKDALDESIETILELAQLKKEKCKGLIVTGCLGERYQDEFFDELPEVDAVIGTGAYEEIATVANDILKGQSKRKYIKDIHSKMNEDNAKLRILSTSHYYAYLKISEGCDNNCTYCVIPKLRGKHRSRTIESLVEEATILADGGVKELVLVAQDTSIYGRDLYGSPVLHKLLEELTKINGIHWIRILYCYPETLTQETINIMSQNPKICHYIDMPIQHGSDTVLKRMGRNTNSQEIREKIQALRSAMPDIAIRTTVITGFPAETNEEFEELKSFINEMKFERLGAFSYSNEDGTPSSKMKNQIEDDVKESRRDEILKLQKDIAFQVCKEQIGNEIEVLVEGKLPDDNIYCGRSSKDSPDIDGIVFLSNSEKFSYAGMEEVISGEFVKVKITDALDYDLIGEIIHEDTIENTIENK